MISIFFIVHLPFVLVECSALTLFLFMRTDFPCHIIMLCLTAQKIETVERHLQVGAKHIEAYYEAYLERHVDVSTVVEVVEGKMVVVLVVACISVSFSHYNLLHTCLSNLLKTYLFFMTLTFFQQPVLKKIFRLSTRNRISTVYCSHKYSC